MTKRTDRNLYTVIQDLKKSGKSVKAIANSAGIATRTLSSYYDYFRADRPNKHSRKPPMKVIRSIKKQAQSKGIRTTQNYGSDPLHDKRVYISVNYKWYDDDNEKWEKRHALVLSTLAILKEKTEHQRRNYLEKQIKKQYQRKDSKLREIEIENYQIKTFDEQQMIHGQQKTNKKIKTTKKRKKT